MIDNPFAHLVGNELIKKQLFVMTAKATIGNSLLFSGISGIGKGLFAYHLAALIFARHDPAEHHKQKIAQYNHPDIHIYRPEGKTGAHSINSMRQFSQEVYMPPYVAPYRIFIIHEADRMAPYSANALLKTFEEPARSSIIILLSSQRYAILPTILSRCRTLYFQPIAMTDIATHLQNTYGVNETKAMHLAKQSKGSIGYAVSLLQKKVEIKTAQEDLLEILSRGKGLSYKQITEAAKLLSSSIEKVKKEVEEAAKEELARTTQDELLAIQKQAFEKEVEGVVSIRYLQEINLLLETILGWYRDMELLAVGGNPAYLIHGSHHEEVEQSLQRGELRPLDRIQQAVAQTKLSIERSTALETALETLFLTLLT